MFSLSSALAGPSCQAFLCWYSAGGTESSQGIGRRTFSIPWLRRLEHFDELVDELIDLRRCASFKEALHRRLYLENTHLQRFGKPAGIALAMFPESCASARFIGAVVSPQTSRITHACPPAPRRSGPERYTTTQHAEATITQQLPQLHNRSSHICARHQWYGTRKGGLEGRLPKRVR